MTISRNPYDNAEAMRRAYAMRLLEQASSAAPVQHPLQALARTLQAGLAAHYARQHEQDEQMQQYPGSDPVAQSLSPGVSATEQAGSVTPLADVQARRPDGPFSMAHMSARPMSSISTAPSGNIGSRGARASQSLEP
jgi:hypothetical protein